MNSSSSSSSHHDSTSSSNSMMSVGFDEEDSSTPLHELLPLGSDNDDDELLTPQDYVTNPLLHHVSIRYSDLTSNSTRYDRLIAAPSDSDMQIMWLGWTIITAICGLIVAVIFMALILSPGRRSKPFNVYLLCLMVPDLLLSVLCCWTCLENYLLGHYSSFWMCHFQSFYCIFTVASNAWLNAVVAYQLHKMLVSAGKFQRYKPPTCRQVLCHAACCYGFALFLASWTLWALVPSTTIQSWWPHQTLLVGGVECLPMDFGTISTIFFYGIFFPCLLGIPLIYTLYLLKDILSNNRLPPRGKRRQLVIYFFRLIVVFVVMWTPGLIFLFVAGQWLNPWIKFIGGSWCHVQGAASAIVSLWKPDVYHALLELLQCKVWRYYKCCRKYYISADKKDLSSTLGLTHHTGRRRRHGLRRNSSFGSSSFRWENISFLGVGFGRETANTTSAFSGGFGGGSGDGGAAVLGDGSSNQLPFGSGNHLDGSSNRFLAAPFGSDDELVLFETRVLSSTTMKDESSVPFSVGSGGGGGKVRNKMMTDGSQDQEEDRGDLVLKEDQYADDASAHLEDEYNVEKKIGGILLDLEERRRDPIIATAANEEEHHCYPPSPSRQEAAMIGVVPPVPQMVDTSSNNDSSEQQHSGDDVVSDNDDDSFLSAGLSLENEDFDHEEVEEEEEDQETEDHDRTDRDVVVPPLSFGGEDTSDPEDHFVWIVEEKDEDGDDAEFESSILPVTVAQPPWRPNAEDEEGLHQEDDDDILVSPPPTIASMDHNMSSESEDESLIWVEHGVDFEDLPIMPQNITTPK